MNNLIHKFLVCFGLVVLIPVSVFELAFFHTYLCLGQEFFGFEIKYPVYSTFIALWAVILSMVWTVRMMGHYFAYGRRFSVVEPFASETKLCHREDF